MNHRLPQWELTLIVLTLAAAAWSATLSPYYLSVGQILYSTRQFVYPGILSIGLAVVVILVRDRYFAGLDAGVRRCPVFQVLGLRRSDLARGSAASSQPARPSEP